MLAFPKNIAYNILWFDFGPENKLTHPAISTVVPPYKAVLCRERPSGW